jgi:hypothetical protein
LTERTTNLDLPYLMPSQAQKHVTHNEALAVLDAVVQLSVQSRGLTAPTGTEADGKRYIVPTDATDAWSGWDGAVAARIDGAWHKVVSASGWIAWVEDEARYVCRTDEGWRELGEVLPSLQQVEFIGIGTTADGVNPFVAKLNKALWSARYGAEGGDGSLRYAMNKEEASGVLSLLMQTDWSGRAEVGLIGDDDFLIKVSDDGAAWKEALRIDVASGATDFPHTPALSAVAGLNGMNGAFVRFTGSGSATMQSIVGTVSQTGGIPTGAIVEGGSNANGVYIRLADGTQFCMASVSSSATADVTWTYPAAFITTPSQCGSGVGTGTTNVRSLTSSSVNATSQALRVVDATNSRVGATANVLAVGRWF